jgi:hypothetical protein
MLRDRAPYRPRSPPLPDPQRKEAQQVIPENTFQKTILFGLNYLGKHVYRATVPASTVAKSRAKNKAARKARRAGRN